MIKKKENSRTIKDTNGEGNNFVLGQKFNSLMLGKPSSLELDAEPTKFMIRFTKRALKNRV